MKTEVVPLSRTMPDVGAIFKFAGGSSFFGWLAVFVCSLL